ncbi:hypothetical protein M011DRAFT_467459 [Sporormia fimetaria CBS 119925]|uniref:DNA repair protein Rad26 n=1 Tax=Sporormia fimetaria CBS 119925 TaxID=1340428 RepID=A0A6A6VDN5_9PLEO|nr:hypothetical protein M011DRAFT_467459 [Sporormia fimetaria CBS 119925]
MNHDDGFHDDEYDFDDDGLDALPDDALQHLETQAIRATQQQAQYYEHDGPEFSHTRAQESDYGVADEGDDGEVYDLNNDIDAGGPTHWGAAPPQGFTENAQAIPETVNAVASQARYLGVPHDAMEVDEPPRRSQADPNQLLERIKKLEQEKARLNREVENEKAMLLKKSGETETARRRLEAANREHERRLQTLQQSHNETLAAQKAELERMRKEREQAQTNNMFLEHDLALEANKVRRTRSGVPIRPRQAAVPSPAATPRRQQKTLPLRDGFDDEDMVLVSPSKTRDRLKASTPKQANKRKRVAADQSPGAVLSLSESKSGAQEQVHILESLTPDLLRNLKQQDRRFELLNLLINYRCSSDGETRVFEALSQHTLPSEPEKKLSSLVYGELSACVLEHDVHELAKKICIVFLTLWDRCLSEKYYASFSLLLDAINLILAYEPCSTAIAITEKAVPIILATVDLVAFPIARACMKYTSSADLYSPAQEKINGEINVVKCLDLLHIIATSCLTSEDAITQFWQCIPIDFPLQLLRKAQPLDCISRMLHILRTSNLSDSIGPRVLTSFGLEQQEKRETDLLDRLTKLLSDIPEPIPNPSTPTTAPLSPNPSQILTLRLQILHLLTHFSTTPYGCTRLASLRYCIGRLIRFLDEQVTSLYTVPLSPTHELTAASINATMRLIFHLKTSVPTLDIKSKLSVIPGGNHKYLVALTRLAFSERLVLEQGIEKETVDAAYAILDAGLTPEEGEGLLQVFSSGGSV